MTYIEEFPWAAEKNVYSDLPQSNILKPALCTFWSMTTFNTTDFLSVYFCLHHLNCGECGVLNSHTTTVLDFPWLNA